MMEFQKVAEIRKRMVKNCSIGCDKCPICSDNNGTKLVCTVFMFEYPERYEQILIDWDKANPIETRLTKLLKEYPDVELGSDGTPERLAPCDLGYKCSDDILCGTDDCWNVPV